jgi:hypothetical protein
MTGRGYLGGRIMDRKEELKLRFALRQWADELDAWIASMAHYHNHERSVWLARIAREMRAEGEKETP